MTRLEADGNSREKKKSQTEKKKIHPKKKDTKVNAILMNMRFLVCVMLGKLLIGTFGTPLDNYGPY